jgi:hypothetical protein
VPKKLYEKAEEIVMSDKREELLRRAQSVLEKRGKVLFIIYYFGYEDMVIVNFYYYSVNYYCFLSSQ